MSESLSPVTLALDLGGTKLSVARMRGQDVLERAQAPTPKPSTPDAVVKAATALASALSADARALGVACAGAVVNGRVTATAVETFPGWTDVPLTDHLSRALGLPCAALNDARAAAWGEFVAGAGQGCQEFMFVTVSTGVGAGLVLGGQLHLAANGLDAEIGFTSVPAGWRSSYTVPSLGELSPLEYESSGTALDRAARAQGFGGARDLADRAEEGDARARELYDHSAAMIAWKLADVAALLGVTRVALGGGVGLRPGYQERVRAALKHFPERYQPEIVPAALGADAGLVGAAHWAERQAAVSS